MNIYVSVAFNHHDSSVAIADDNKILIVLEAERYFRKKKMACTVSQMDELILAALRYVNYGLSEVAGWSMATLNNEYLREEERYTRKFEWKEVNILGEIRKVLIVNHHYAHACVYYAFPINNAFINSCDGGGDAGERNKFYIAKDDNIEELPINTDHFINAKFYDITSQHTYSSFRSEGKLMALSAFGTYREDYASYLESGLINPLSTDKSYDNCLKFLDGKFLSIAGSGKTPSQNTMDFAATVQEIFERERLKDIKTVIDKYPDFENMILVGGAALNIKLNSMVYAQYPKKNLFIAPCCDDTGQALGALLCYGVEVIKKRFELKFPFLGYGEKENKLDESVLNKIISYLKKGEIIAWHYDRAEIGPRALGHRSFLAAATSVEMKVKLSEKLKQREWYRPVAPIILDKYAHEWFEKPHVSPFMLFSSKVRKEVKKLIPAAVHIDGTARLQTITESDPVLYKILLKYYEVTGVPLLLNTSLNLQGDPITNTYDDLIDLSKRAAVPVKLFFNGKELSQI